MPYVRPREESRKLHAKIRKIHAGGVGNMSEIARRCGVALNTVRYVLGRPHMTRDERAAARRKLWAEQRSLGITIAAIAKASKVSPGHVRKILREVEGVPA